MLPLQDPPSMIPDLLRRWEEGFKIVIGVKVESEERAVMYALRSLYYWLAAKLSCHRMAAISWAVMVARCAALRRLVVLMVTLLGSG